jgi:hypothetical protein
MKLEVSTPTPTRDFVQWVARKPRTYAETMQAWRSSCPRLTVWEDALADGLVRLDYGAGVPIDATAVVLTCRGVAVLEHQR